MFNITNFLAFFTDVCDSMILKQVCWQIMLL